MLPVCCHIYSILPAILGNQEWHLHFVMKAVEVSVSDSGAEELVLLKCGAGENLRVPWTARGSNQSILKEIKRDYSLEGLMLNLQYFGHFMRRADSLEKALMLGRLKAKREGGGRG